MKDKTEYRIFRLEHCWDCQDCPNSKKDIDECIEDQKAIPEEDLDFSPEDGHYYI